MILIAPFLLMTLHFSQIGFTDDLTFMLNLLSKKTVLNYNMQKRVMQAFPSENTRISFGKSLFIRKFAVHPEIPALFRKDNFLFISPDNTALA